MKKVMILWMMSLVVLSVSAQKPNREAKMEQMKAEKISFITQQLSLTTAEAQAFWPVYNEYEGKREVLHKQSKTKMMEFKKIESTATTAQKEAAADGIVNMKMDFAKLDLEYHKKFKAVLSADKLLTLYQSEMKFRRHLLDGIGGHKKGAHCGDGDAADNE